MARQFFYLVVRTYDESTTPLKVFLQEREAVAYGRRLATKEVDNNADYNLYKQVIDRTSTLKYVRTLHPFEEQLVDELEQLERKQEL